MSAGRRTRPSRVHRFAGPSVILAAAVAVAGAACAGDRDRGRTAGSPPRTDAQAAATATMTGTLTVLAAASLTEAFTDIGRAFEAANPGVKVNFSFAASSTLATQANQGAPADLFASADEHNMARVVDAGHASGPVVFARNRLALLVEQDNPKEITGLADLGRRDVIFVLCAPEAPCGRLGREALDRAGVGALPRSFEESVKAVVTRVTLGEADAGIVFATDAAAAGDAAHAIAIPDEHNPLAVYPIAVLGQAAKPPLAAAFQSFVGSEAGQRILARYGFLPPT